MKIAIGNDHTGVAMKNDIVTYLTNNGYEVINIGTNDGQAADYPNFGHQVGQTVANGVADLGIVICGTGIGISIAANKVPGVRAALCYETTTAQLAREHNNANVLALGARLIANQKAIWIVEAFLKANFDEGRHARRVNQIEDITC
ncbi:ribose 5-phosphate isomerase B [Spiroplasma chrysopicola]|uniref:Ribose-5-phosphate isomerase B n=1 Tax=Spiroplasma chrysopicola DF-1 TaxID=1276227 RepID=R4UF16_9MOLU|nr:ribose 5-phosphate isomerase B [Spiroplasma chrysopicola]AGM24705.1 ribose-5-phosphate isomerase B [Spiroplasma chrysopicola DF-1]